MRIKIKFFLIGTVLILFGLPDICPGNANGKLSLHEAEPLLGLKPLQEITNDEVWSMLGAQGYSYQDHAKATGNSYLVKDGKVTQLCGGFGGVGITSLCVSDLNQNQKPELIFLYQAGSGVNYTIPGCYEDGVILNVPFHARYHHNLRLKKTDSLTVQIVTDWQERIELAQDKKTAVTVGRKEIIVGVLFFEDHCLKLKMENGIPDEIRENIQPSVFRIVPEPPSNPAANRFSRVDSG